jgi:hypothetical protein
MPSQRPFAQTGKSSLAALLALAWALSGCGEARRVFAAYPEDESPGVAAAPYPALVDMPTPAALRESAPDPEEGRAIAAALGVEAAAQRAEAERLAPPVTDAGALGAAAAAARAGR